MKAEEKPQIDKFKEAAREHEADESAEHWDEQLKRVVKPKPSDQAAKGRS